MLAAAWGGELTSREECYHARCRHHTDTHCNENGKWQEEKQYHKHKISHPIEWVSERDRVSERKFAITTRKNQLARRRDYVFLLKPFFFGEKLIRKHKIIIRKHTILHSFQTATLKPNYFKSNLIMNQIYTNERMSMRGGETNPDREDMWRMCVTWKGEEIRETKDEKDEHTNYTFSCTKCGSVFAVHDAEGIFFSGVDAYPCCNVQCRAFLLARVHHHRWGWERKVGSRRFKYIFNTCAPSNDERKQTAHVVWFAESLRSNIESSNSSQTVVLSFGAFFLYSIFQKV